MPRAAKETDAVLAAAAPWAAWLRVSSPRLHDGHRGPMELLEAEVANHTALLAASGVDAPQTAKDRLRAAQESNLPLVINRLDGTHRSISRNPKSLIFAHARSLLRATAAVERRKLTE